MYINIVPIEDPIAVASAGSIKTLSKSGKKTRPKVSVTPTKIDPIKAPLIDPIPPMTITTKAKIKIGSPIPTSTDCMAPIIAPDNPARAAPNAKTTV